jgi:hypothetical protein
MTNGEDQLRQIRERISRANSAKARAQVEQETAQARRQQSLEALQRDFGITSPEDISRVSSELDAELKDAVAQATSALDAAEAS